MAINANVIRPCFKFWANEVRVCLYTVFSTFEMDPSTPLNILVKLPNLKVIYVSFEASEELRKFTGICMLAGKFVPPTIQTPVKFRDFE